MMSFTTSSGDMLPSPWKPSVSSPLASSPIRTLATDSPTHDETQSQRVVQSSPIQRPTFRFSSRPAKPNPMVRRREDMQEQRMRNFMQNVRQKAEDKAWQRRDIEGQSLKTSWLANIGRLSHDAPTLSEDDIEDAMAHSQDAAPQSQSDEEMLQAIREEDELDFLVSSYEQQQQQQQTSPFDREYDGDGYDEIFAELISREPAGLANQPSPASNSENQMDTSD